MYTNPPLCERSVLSPDRPELMDNSVGDCLSAMLQEDMLMGRDRLYGSRFNAEADNTVRTNHNKAVHMLPKLPQPKYFNLHLLPGLVPPGVDGEACMEQHQQPTPLTQIHPETTERNPPGNPQQQLQV